MTSTKTKKIWTAINICNDNNPDGLASDGGGGESGIFLKSSWVECYSEKKKCFDHTESIIF